MTCMWHIKKHLNSQWLTINISAPPSHRSTLVAWLTKAPDKWQFDLNSKSSQTATRHRTRPLNPKHQLQRMINQTICVALKGNGKMFGEQTQTTGGSFMLIFSHSWKCWGVCQVSTPIGVNAMGAWLDGFLHAPSCHWALLAWKRLDTPAGMVKKAQGQSHASCWYTSMFGWSSVCLSMINSDDRSPVLHWISLFLTHALCRGRDCLYVYKFQSLKKIHRDKRINMLYLSYVKVCLNNLPLSINSVTMNKTFLTKNNEGQI